MKVKRDSSPHSKSRNERPSEYPERVVVPDSMVSWEVPFPGYAPIDFTAQIVLQHDSSRNPNDPTLWADPPDPRRARQPMLSFEGDIKFRDDRPLNPRGRTGLAGRGELGRWGPNFAADPIVTRMNPESQKLEMICIRRGDCGELAIPGGMVDSSDRTISRTLSRELGEETSADLDFAGAHIVYRGYVDDRRNTDNAWIETSVAHVHLSPEQAQLVRLEARDDAMPGSAAWVEITSHMLGSMYASHGTFVERAIEEAVRRGVIPDHSKLILPARHDPVLRTFASLHGRVGIFGGSFDPVTNAHIAVAEQVRTLCQLDHVVFLPTPGQPLKNPPQASKEQRFEMLRLALQCHPGLSVSDWEFHRPGFTPTAVTVHEIRKLLPLDASLFWIVGSDALATFKEWIEPQKIFEEATVITVARQPLNDSHFAQASSLGSAVVSHLRAHALTIQPIPGSSSEVRDKCSLGRPILDLVPESVSAYMSEQRLYRS